MFQYSFMQNALIISILISIICPCIGVFLVLRRHSMIGDTLAHSSLAGVALGLVFGQNPIISAFIFTSLCSFLIEVLKNYYKKYTEIILVIVMSLSIGIAITLISSGQARANVNSFLFGSILTVTKQDLLIVSVLCLITLIVLFVFFNQLVYITFDEEGAKVAGVKVKLIDYVFSIIVAAAISVSIRVVGVLVLSSMIALPVASAIQLQKGFRKTLVYSIIISIIDIISGLVISYYVNAAAGGVIAITSVIMLVIVITIKKAAFLFKNKILKETL
ncbi:metal ABC transporter permease [Clostridium oryzae]|uniref:High-affinity zinc uptake system membrane protein ZnuB n=1 Tax=Clostridium oryzae TaxID=1450648 RepID=A0A1V4IXV7_9CLOT|nr:metal ABC transporter permease [Clostridium oryzae]OPJ64604.1 high-affinity zinc uptake system membrane protein ZnuB [Clostridium oryzae]